jgi:nucleoside-diphosphate-sugar epimerase
LNVLVVGGAGYVGGAVTDIVPMRGYSLRVYDDLLYEEAYRKPVDFCFGDVRDEKRLRHSLEWADAVVWLAAIVGDGACGLNPDLATSVNERAVGFLADCFDGRIIFTSTCSVYGAQDSVIDENAPLNPLSLYAVNKMKAEEHLRAKNAIIFRLGTLYGVSDTYSRIRLDLVVNTLTVRAFRDRRITIFGGNQYRPILHVRDAAKAIVDAIERDQTGIFNLHSANVRIVELAEQIRSQFPGLEIGRTDLMFQDNRTYRVSSERARKALGFSPKLSVDDGVKELQLLLQQGRIKNLSAPRYTNAYQLEAILPSQPYRIDEEMPARI